MSKDMSKLTFKGDNGRDDFQRELVAERAIQLLTSDIEISPMVIDGDWGTGKTEFCHKLINKFEHTDDDFKLLYIDAFQADHADNPLMTVLSSVMTLLPEGEQKNTLLQRALPVMRYSMATAGKAVFNHLLRQNADEIADELEGYLQDAADQAIDSSMKALLKDHEKAQENLEALQKSLEEITKDSPIVIFIDELDRCRPDFAVQMLEVIKHTFDVDHLQFVLVTNTRQLKAAINHCYGSLVDAQRYLDKFLRFSFPLPEHIPGSIDSSGEATVVAVEHFSKLVKDSSTLKNSDLTDRHGAIYQFTRTLIVNRHLSLREVETFVRHLEIYHELSDGLNNSNIFGYQLLNIFSVFVFCLAPDITVSIQQNRVDASEVLSIMGLSTSLDYRPDLPGNWHAEFIAVILTQGSALNREIIKLSAEAKDLFEQDKLSCFSGRFDTPDRAYNRVKEAIKYLQLAGTK